MFCSRLRGQTVLDCIGRADSCSTTAFPFHSHFPGAESLLGLYLLLTIWVLILSSLHTKFVLETQEHKIPSYMCGVGSHMYIVHGVRFSLFLPLFRKIILGGLQIYLRFLCDDQISCLEQCERGKVSGKKWPWCKAGSQPWTGVVKRPPESRLITCFPGNPGW